MNTTAILDIPAKEISAPEIASIKKLWYGVADGNYVLEVGKSGFLTILFDNGRPGRGIEVTAVNGHLALRFAVPTGKEEIELFFQLIDALLRRYHLDSFTLDGQSERRDDISETASQHIARTETVLKLISDSLTGDDDIYCIFGVYHPLSLNRSIMDQIGTSAGAFGDWLAGIQREQLYYAAPHYFTHNLTNRTIGVYYLNENLKSIFPYDPAPAYSCWQDCDYYVNLPGENVISYDSFLDNIQPEADYDGDHFLLTPDYTKIKYLAKNSIDITSGEPVKVNQYWGEPIDDGTFHQRKIIKSGFNIDGRNGFSHIALFLRWMGEHQLLSKELRAAIPELEEMIRDRQDIRETIEDSEVFEGAIRPGHFNQAGRLFAASYYLDDSLAGYMSAIDRHAQAHFGWTRYSTEFEGEAYLFVPYDEDYYQAIKPDISRAWGKFLDRQASNLISRVYHSEDNPVC